MSKIHPSYSFLNDVKVPVVGERIDLKRRDVKGIIRDLTEKLYIPDSLSNSGPYKAIVLRVEEDSVDPTSPITRYKEFTSDPNQKVTVEIKARIPEIHAMLPIPESLGDRSTQSSIIDMYPTFIGMGDDLVIPNVGSLVWVDFGNKNDFTDPIYIRPVFSQLSQPNSVGSISAKNQHQSACTGQFLSDAPAGDSLPGGNKNITHAGQPLSQRMPASVFSNEFRFLKGDRFSSISSTRWEKAIRNANIPCISWIGNLSSNGIEDIYHPSGKRDTIIFAPNTTDFSSPIEVIIFFHSFKEFGAGKEFYERFAKSFLTMIEGRRNFVFVIPELPWSTQVKNNPNSASSVWRGRDNFSKFYIEVESKIKDLFSKNVVITQKTIIAYGQGGRALSAVASDGSLSSVTPNKIIFADAVYQDHLDVVWNSYVKNNNKVELDILCQKNSVPSKNTLKFINKYLKNYSSNFYFKEYSSIKNSEQIGNLSITFINNDRLDKLNESRDIDTQQAIDNPPNDYETQEGPAVVDSIQDRRTDIVEQPDSQIPPITNFNISPSVRNKNSSTKKNIQAKVSQAKSFTESRVRVEDYTSLKGNEEILVNVPSPPGSSQERLHILAAKRFNLLRSQWKKEHPEQPDMYVTSGWRRHSWTSFQQYEDYLIREYKSVENGRKYRAYNSPHETGLAFDIGDRPLLPSSKTNPQQKNTIMYRWLKNNAHKFGITPYKVEAWHWEVRIPAESFATGEEFTNNLAVRVEDPGQSELLPKSSSPYGQNCVNTVGMSTSIDTNIPTPNSIFTPSSTTGKLLDDKKKQLILELSSQLGIEPEIALAFFTVESGGRSGFDVGTGRAIIKFEPHVFANPKRLSDFNISPNNVPWSGGSSKEIKQKYSSMGFSYCSSVTSKCQQEQYKALDYAIKLYPPRTEELAYSSISIGAAQIMGYNHSLVGYKSAKDMFIAYSNSEESQIRGFFFFVTKRGNGKLLNALKQKDFVTAARFYNGKGKEEHYGSKLAVNYEENKKRGVFV